MPQRQHSEKRGDFGKGCKQSFTEEVFVIASVPTLHPPTCSLIDADKEDEFTVNVNSSASLKIFDQNTLAPFRIFL